MDPVTRQACARRREALRAKLQTPAAIGAGGAPPRNYPANPYPYRASSHFLYLVGMPLPDAVLWLSDHEEVLLLPAPDPDDDLWHGPSASADELSEQTGLPVRPLSSLPALARGQRVACTPMAGDREGGRALDAQLGRTTEDGQHPQDAALLRAVVALRVVHDEAAQAQLREAAALTVRGHLAGMAATRAGDLEQQVCAEMEAVFARAGCTTAYGSIVTTHGQVLHDHSHGRTMGADDLLLCDVGAETQQGWAADVTRTWPVGGRFSPSQRALYELVLAAQHAALQRVRPGERYRDVHLAAARVFAQGLVDEGVLRGEVDGLVERGSHALFFPHGIGHLLGLDVHDMEDLGDLAGYAEGRSRDPQFGLSYLRLDRDLEPGMAVTIEPGLYIVPALLEDPGRVGLSATDLNRERLARFADVRGIRIEDDVLVTESGHEVLSAALPKQADEVEQLVGTAAS